MKDNELNRACTQKPENNTKKYALSDADRKI